MNTVWSSITIGWATLMPMKVGHAEPPQLSAPGQFVSPEAGRVEDQHLSDPAKRRQVGRRVPGLGVAGRPHLTAGRAVVGPDGPALGLFGLVPRGSR